MLLSEKTRRDRVRAVKASDAATPPAMPGADDKPQWRFTVWRRQRPFIGGVLVAIAGVEMFFSGQLDIGHLHVQMGIEGLQATIIPVLLVLLGVLSFMMPAHHIFYGVIALAVGVYAIIGVNLGGFLIGTILACVGGVLVVAWMTPEARAKAKDKALTPDTLDEEPDAQREEPDVPRAKQAAEGENA